MYFRNLQVFRFINNGLTLEALETALAASPFVPCAENQAASTGWTSPRKNGLFVHAVNQQWLITLVCEQRSVPGAVVNKEVARRIEEIEARDGRRVGRKEKRELKECVAQELLPRAFAKETRTTAWIDPVNGWLCIDSGTAGKAEELVGQLRRATDKLKITNVRLAQAPSTVMAGWLTGEVPEGFSIDQDGELRSAENQVIKYVHHSLDGKEITDHLAAGKLPTKLAMTYNDRLSFVMTDKFSLKRLSFLDVIKEQATEGAENAEEIFDNEFALMTGETAQFLNALIAAMGGEQAREDETEQA